MIQFCVPHISHREKRLKVSPLIVDNNQIPRALAAPQIFALSAFMKFILYLALLLFTSRSAFAVHEQDLLKSCRHKNPNWFQCNKDSDCIIVGNVCGWPTEAANREHSDAASACYRHLGAIIGCPSYDEKRDGKYKAICEARICAVEKIDQ